MKHFIIERGKRVFYGWWLVGVGVIAVVMTGGFFFHGFQFYFEPMRKQFGWSRTVLSGAATLARAESGFLGPAGGWLVQKHGAKFVMTTGFILFAIGMVLLGMTSNVAMFYISFLLLSIGMGLGSWTPSTALITTWFQKNRAKAIGFMMFGMGLGGFLVAPIVATIINATSWQTTAFISAAVISIIGLPLTRVIKNTPEDMNLLPDGKQSHVFSKTSKVVEKDNSSTEISLTAREAIKTRNFWLLSIGHGIALMTVSGLNIHLVPFLQSGKGFSTLGAAQGLAIMMGAATIAPLLGGILGDRYPKKYLASLTMLLHMAAILLLARSTKITTIYLALLVQGLAWGVRGPILTAMRGDLFGPKNFPIINGFTQLVTMFPQMLAPLLIGYLADKGHYPLGFEIIAYCCLGGLFLFFFIQPPIMKQPIGRQG